MARVLIIGCGCRGQRLARELQRTGHAVRGTTRDPEHMTAIEASGAEAVIADPDRVGTLIGALEGVAVACLLLGSATGTPEDVQALHTTRLEMLLTRMIDTTIRGIVYEATGTVSPDLLQAGAALVQAKCAESRIPYAILRARDDPARAIEALLTAEC